MTNSNHLNADLVNAGIAFHRAVFRVRPVELHERPGWFSKRVCWSTAGWGRLAAQCGLDDLQRRVSHHGVFTLWDHWGRSTTGDGRTVFVTEPYPPSDINKLAAAVADVAELLGVHTRILCPWQSWWYPGSTLRIEFAECTSEPVCRGCKSQHQLRDESRRRKEARYAA